MPKRPNWRAVKIHRNYTVEECAAKLGIAKGTVLRWIKNQVLPAITDSRPFLVLGSDLKDFGRRGRAAKQKCRLHECYCFTCRAVREPAARMADLTAKSATVGDLAALCAHCSSVMHKRVSLAQTPRLSVLLDLTIRQATSPIEKCSQPSLNAHM